MPRMKANRLPNMLAFNGSSDFLTLPITPAVTGFNLAFWFIKRNHTSLARVLDWQEGGPTNGFSIYEDTVNTFSYATRDAGGVLNGFISGKGRPNARLVHCVVTFDGTTMKVYENGVLIGTDGSSVMTTSAQTFTIARRCTSAANYWNGKIGEVVFQNTTTPWTQTQVTNLYYNGNIPSGASYWLFNGNVLDGSGNGKHGTLTGGTYVYQNAGRITPRFMGGSTLFNGSTSVVQISNRPIYNLVNYSVSFWFKAHPTATDKYLIQEGKNDTAVPFWGIGYYDATATNYRLRAFIRDDANNAISGAGYLTEVNLVHGRWYHATVTDAGGSLKCYINGSFAGITTPYTRATTTLNQTAFGAAWRTGLTAFFGGKLAEVKIFNSVLTAEQAKELYSTGSVSGVSPVANYALDDKPSTYIDSISGNNGTGTATTYSTDVPVQQRMAVVDDRASLYFAAVGDVINYGNLGGTVGDTWSTVIREKMKTGSYGITLEARVWNKGSDHIRTTSTGAPSGSINGTVFTGTAGFFLFDNKWHEYGFTYDGANVKCYRDGLLNQSVALVATATDTASDFSAGNRTAGSRALDGWLKSFRHYRNRVLTADEIRGLYFSRTEPSTTGLLINSKLNEGSGSTATDSSGNGNNGTITGATLSSDTPSKSRVPVSILPQKSLYFGESTSAVVAIPDSVAIRPETTKKFTWSFWVYLYSISNNVLPRFIEKGSTYACFMGDMTNGRRRNVALEMANSVGGTATEYWGHTKLSPNRWYHVVMTFDDITAQHYVNGEAEGMTTIGGPYVSPMTSESGVTMKIGNRASGSRNPLGMIADFKVWNRALSASEARDVFNGRDVNDGLVGAWKLDDGSGATVVDSVSGNNGTITSATWRSHPSIRTTV